MNVEKDTQIKLSVVIATYRHEKYIRQCLESVLMQEVDFPMEVLVGDDASPDHTGAIIREIASAHPGFFTLFLREKNLGPIDNFTDLYSRTRGEYLIVLEGDDYWTDKRKLQKEVDFLDHHPDFIAVAHPCSVVDASSKDITKEYPYQNTRKKVFSYKEYYYGKMPGQTATLMFRNFYRDRKLIKGTYHDHAPSYPGDRKNVLLLMANGKIGVLPERMSCYRYVFSSGESWTAKQRREKSRSQILEAYIQSLKDYLEYVDSIKMKDSRIRYIHYLLYVVRREYHALDKNNPAPKLRDIPSEYRLGLLPALVSKVIRHYLKKGE